MHGERSVLHGQITMVSYLPKEQQPLPAEGGLGEAEKDFFIFAYSYKPPPVFTPTFLQKTKTSNHLIFNLLRTA